MSLNTANLITTANGQAALADVYHINAKLAEDNVKITVQLMFPYIVFSSKTAEEIIATESVTQEQVRDELAWANVDVCQVQKYAELGQLKRDFAIGALFDIKEDLSGVRTAILYARTILIDNRTGEQEKTALEVVAEYGYEPVMLPYAYTLMLNSEGMYEDDGISISASRYGRSRHRFYFNYIIDNNDGIADNITVDDDVYPYSDGYLSKTAFTEGLRRYEDVMEEYHTEYEKYVKGHLVCYSNRADAVKYASPTHKFFIEDDVVVKEGTKGGLVADDIREASTQYGWSEFPSGGKLSSATLPTYKGLTPVQYDESPSTLSVKEGVAMFEFCDVRPVEYTYTDGSAETKLTTVKFYFMYFLRTGLPASRKLAFCSVYNYLRCKVIVDDVRFGFETKCTPIGLKTSFFKPYCPSIGKIKVKEWQNGRLTMMAGVLAEIVNVEANPDAPETYIFKGASRFYRANSMNESQTEGGSSGASVSQIAEFEQYNVEYNEEDDVGGLTNVLTPNFAAGYVFYVPRAGYTDIYRYPKNFDVEEIRNNFVPYRTVDTILTPDATYQRTCIGADTALVKSNNYVSFGFADDGDGMAISPEVYSEEPVRELQSEVATVLRDVHDSHLHNARVYVTDNLTNDGSLQTGANTKKLAMTAYMDNHIYFSVITYQDLIHSNECFHLRLLEASKNSTETTLYTKWGFTKYTHDDDEDVDNWEYVEVEYSDSGINRPRRIVAIEDIDGNTNLIRETIS